MKWPGMGWISRGLQKGLGDKSHWVEGIGGQEVDLGLEGDIPRVVATSKEGAVQ